MKYKITIILLSWSQLVFNQEYCEQYAELYKGIYLKNEYSGFGKTEDSNFSINYPIKTYNANDLYFNYIQKYLLTDKRYVQNVNVVLKNHENNSNIVVNLNKNYTHNNVKLIDINALKKTLISEITTSLKNLNYTSKIELIFSKEEIKKIHDKQFLKLTSKIKYENRYLIFQTMYIYLVNQKSCFITLTSVTSLEELYQVEKDTDVLLKTIKISN